MFAQARLYEDYNQGTKDPQGFTNDVGEKGDEKGHDEKDLAAIARAHTLHTAEEQMETYEVLRTFRDPQARWPARIDADAAGLDDRLRLHVPLRLALLLCVVARRSQSDATQSRCSSP